jgi:hypothetical protein
MPARYRHLGRPLAVAVALLGAACSDGTGPGPAKPVDPLATAANIQGLNTSFGSPAFQSFALAANYSPAATSALGPLRTLLRTAQPAFSGRALTAAESRGAAAAFSAALVPNAAVLPPAILGTTFEWNTSTAQYAATARTGAPVNGVRFILYALDVNGAPIVAQEIGYADLLDESTSSTQKIHILVVGLNPAVTYLDYTISATATAASATLAAFGYITDGVERLDFNATSTGTASSAAFDIRFDVNAAGAHVRLRFTLTAPAANVLKATVNLRLQFGDELLTVTGSETVNFNTQEDTGTLTVMVNGGIYATVSIVDGNPTYTGGGGQALTADDLTALNAIFAALGTVANQFDALIAPAASLGG